MNELKQLPTQWRERAKRIAPMSLPMQTKADALLECADELDAIIRKYEEPTEAMVDAGAKAIRNDSGLTTKSGLEWGEYEQGARACFKAMMEVKP